MASNIKYPENNVLYFIEGSRIGLLTKVDSDGDSRTSNRKKWKAISEAVTDGLLIHYYAEPNSVASIKSSMDLDNALQRAVVDYVKKCLYMDRAGVSPARTLDANQSAEVTNGLYVWVLRGQQADTGWFS